MSTIQCEILIVGGGPVGGTLACALAGAGMEVALVDREPPSAALAPDYDGRALAVALASKNIFSTLGLWEGMAPHAAAIEQIRVADGKSPLHLHYDHREMGQGETTPDPFGWIVEHRALRHALALRLEQYPTLARLAPAQLVSLERGPAGVTARLADGTEIAARLAVAADGRNSTLRQEAGIGVSRSAYDSGAIVCTVAHEHDHHNVAVEHFRTPGPFAILPLPGRRSSVVWTEKPHLVEAISKLPDAEFLAELSSRFGDFLGGIEVVGPRFTYPLVRQIANAYGAERLALVGDSAHVIHPVAGQGMNMGLRDAAALAEAVVDARRLGLDIGEAPVVERYAQRRRMDNLLMVGFTDGLVRLFSNDLAAVRLIRDAGMAAVDRMPAAKKIFTRYAMGLAGNPPRLMRGLPL